MINTKRKNRQNIAIMIALALGVIAFGAWKITADAKRMDTEYQIRQTAMYESLSRSLREKYTRDYYSHSGHGSYCPDWHKDSNRVKAMLGAR